MFCLSPQPGRLSWIVCLCQWIVPDRRQANIVVWSLRAQTACVGYWLELARQQAELLLGHQHPTNKGRHGNVLDGRDMVIVALVSFWDRSRRI